MHLLGGKPVVRLSVLTNTLHQSVFWSVDGCCYTTLLPQPAGRCIRNHRGGMGGGRGGRGTPKFFNF